MVEYIFRKPKYPLLIETDGRVISARNMQRIDRLDKQALFANKDSYIVIDSSGEGWGFLPDLDVISPLAILKRWNKPKIIALFNTSLEKVGSSARYEARSLSSKRLEQVILEIVEFENTL